MSEYHLYLINRNGHIDRPAKVFNLQYDEEAIQEASALLDGHDVEVWQGTRRVAHLAAGDKGPTIRRKAG